MSIVEGVFKGGKVALGLAALTGMAVFSGIVLPVAKAVLQPAARGLIGGMARRDWRAGASMTQPVPSAATPEAFMGESGTTARQPATATPPVVELPVVERIAARRPAAVETEAWHPGLPDRRVAAKADRRVGIDRRVAATPAKKRRSRKSVPEAAWHAGMPDRRTAGHHRRSASGDRRAGASR
ncbi:MAG: hypothetical protein ACOY5C_04725 [Pseudomonadota bacterium]